MPTGTPIFLKVGPGGILFPYYEGHFKGVSGGSTSAIEIEVRTRKTGEVFAPEYYPDYVTFKTPKSVIELPGGGGALARPGAPIAQLWAETPDTTNPPAGILNRKRLLIGIGGTQNGKLLLDSAGESDFDNIVAALPRISANTQAGISGAEVVRWSFTPARDGKYGAIISGQGSSAAAANRFFEVRINEVIAGYLDHAFTGADISQYRTFTTSAGAYTSQVLNRGVTYLIRIVAYAPSPPYSDANNVFQGFVYKWG